MTMAEAQQALSDLGLVSGAVTSGGHSDLPEGQVMSQTIAPGSHVDSRNRDRFPDKRRTGSGSDRAKYTG